MPFISLNFAYFFLVFYPVYLLLNRYNRIQNLWLLAGSYFFYAAWDWRFLFVLLGITLSNYVIGLGLGEGRKAYLVKPALRRLVLVIGLIGNVGCLVFFKYADFFKAGLVRLLDGTGFAVDALLVDVILPVGLSFYALQASSYLLDVSARRIQPTRNLLDLALFIGFFPQLLAGPIERAGRMLPQFHHRRKLDPGSFSAGFYLLLSGFFKKLVVADNLGNIANAIFDNSSAYLGIDLVIAVLAFTFQLYADFSAYSDIARGLARWMGFELVVNFRLPYFATTPADFWSRWHISLSEWLRDYIFFPVRRALLRWKGRTGKVAGLLLPPLVTMVVSGLWHGTGWNFILWGIYHAVLMILFQVLVRDKPLDPIGRTTAAELSGISQVLAWLRLRCGIVFRLLFMFVLVSFGWLIFRVESFDQLAYFLTHFSLSASPESAILWANFLLYSLPLFVVQIIQQVRGELLNLARLPVGLRLVVYATALALMIVLAVRQSNEFIYVQF